MSCPLVDAAIRDLLGLDDEVAEPSLADLLGGDPDAFDAPVDLPARAQEPEVSALDTEITATRFPDQFGSSKKEGKTTLRKLGERFRTLTAVSKGDLPFFKLASFGNVPNRADQGGRCLRYDANVLSVHGVEVDYDKGEIAPLVALERFRKADLAVLLYTTPSHRQPGKGERWRAMLPLSKAMAPHERAALVARVNGVFEGALASESFVLSQSFYAGGIGGQPGIEVHFAEGRFLDQARDLDAGAVWTAKLKRPMDGGPAARPPEVFGLSIKDLRRMLDGLPTYRLLEYDGWYPVIGAVRDEFGGDCREALDAVDEWSRRGNDLIPADDPRQPVYERGAVEAKWESFASTGNRPRLTIRALLDESSTGPEIIDTVYVSKFEELPPLDGDAETNDAGEVKVKVPVNLTEDAAALQFTSLYGGKIRFCHSTEAWYQWTGSRWKRNDTKVAFHFARELSRTLARSKEKATIATAGKASFAGSVERLARSDPAMSVTADMWDRDPMLLGTPNGTIDLRTGRMRSAHPDDGITKQTSVGPSNRDCTLWKRFLHESTGGDKETVRFLQQFAGYCLTGLTIEHALMFIYGQGGNGKSVFLNVLAGILLDYAVNAPAETFMASRNDRHPTELARLRGARLVTSSETEAGKAFNDKRIKEMTGGDKITARFMGQDFFEYQPQFKLMIVGNFKPNLARVSDALTRRICIIPFDRKPETPDVHLDAKLKEEWPAILTWMVEGCLDWQQNGLVKPESVRKATDIYFEEQDLISQWLEECCVISPEDEAMSMRTANSDLYASWKRFAERAGEFAGSQRSLTTTLQQRGFRECGKVSVGDKRLRGLFGIKVVQYTGFDDLPPEPDDTADKPSVTLQ